MRVDSADRTHEGGAGIEPAAYLAEATRRAIAYPGTVTLPSDLANR